MPQKRYDVFKILKVPHVIYFHNVSEPVTFRFGFLHHKHLENCVRSVCCIVMAKGVCRKSHGTVWTKFSNTTACLYES